jgi:hypothetical protein
VRTMVLCGIFTFTLIGVSYYDSLQPVPGEEPLPPPDLAAAGVVRVLPSGAMLMRDGTIKKSAATTR